MVELIEEKFFVWVAPDGHIQLSTISEDPIICESYCKLLHKKGLGQSPHQMKLKGFSIQPIVLTIRKAINKNIN